GVGGGPVAYRAAPALDRPSPSPSRTREGDKVSALFAYLCAGMRSAIAEDTVEIAAHLGQADIFIDDTPLAARTALGIDQQTVAAAYPRLIHVSVLPFGAHGSKAEWKGEEITVLHASGEGY